MPLQAGLLCEQSFGAGDLEPKASPFCQNGGACQAINVPYGFECICAPEFTGKHCEMTLESLTNAMVMDGPPNPVPLCKTRQPQPTLKVWK